MATKLHTSRNKLYTLAMNDGRTTREAKRDRQRAMRELVARAPVSSQEEFVELLSERGYKVTQATVSRDIAEPGLVKVVRADRHVYASPEDLAAPPSMRSHDALRRRAPPPPPQQSPATKPPAAARSTRRSRFDARG